MPNIIDLSGHKFGRLTVIEFVGRKNKHSMFKCLCDCGGSVIVTSNNLRTKHTVSCGCYNNEKTIERSITHGLSRHPLYLSWIGMRNRCYYKKHNRFSHYGGKGIKVCSEWKEDFQAFYDWAILNGWRKGLSIDRKENDKDYSPNNCKFSTIPQQNRNRTSNVRLTIDGVTKILIEWAETGNIKYATLRRRLQLGWPPKEAVFGKTT